MPLFGVYLPLVCRGGGLPTGLGGRSSGAGGTGVECSLQSTIPIRIGNAPETVELGFENPAGIVEPDQRPRQVGYFPAARTRHPKMRMTASMALG
jgi:hypothetical protein